MDLINKLNCNTFGKTMKRIMARLIVFGFLLSFTTVSTIVADFEPTSITCGEYTQATVQLSSKTVATTWESWGRYTNSTGTTQQGSVTLSRTQSSSFGISGTLEIDLLLKKVAISAEYNYNTSKTKTTTQTTSVPAFKTYYARYGSDLVYGRARFMYTYPDCSVSYGPYFNYRYTTRDAFEWYQ